MAQSDLEVGNAALYKLGATIVGAVDGTDPSKEGQVVAARLEPCKRALLRMHPWNFATRREVILPPSSYDLTTPFVELASSEVLRITTTSAYSVGDYVTVADSGVTEADGIFRVITGASPLTLRAPGVTSLTGTPAAGTIRQSPPFTYQYLYDLPSDCLRLLEINELDVTSMGAWCDSWRVEGRKILSNVSMSLPIRYIYDVVDYVLMDIEFYECLATYLAWDICDHITGDDNKKRALWTDLHGGDGKVGLLPRSRFADATEDSQQTMQTSDWLGSRGGWMGSAGIPPVFLG